MKKVIFWVSIAIFLSFVIISLSLISKNKDKVKEEIIKNNSVSKTILMVSDNSKFKKELREKLVNDYKSSYSIEIKNLSILKRLDVKKYSLVIVIDSIWMWERMNKEIVSFAKKHENEKNTLFLLSAGDPKYKFSNSKVDSITVATEKVKLSEIYSNIKNRINLKLNIKENKKIETKKIDKKVDSTTNATKKNDKKYDSTTNATKENNKKGEK